MFEFEDASTIEEVSTPIMTLYSVTRQKLLESPNPNFFEARASTKLIHMEQMIILEKMDRYRLKEKLESKDNCHANECKHCGSSITLFWKVKETVEKGGLGWKNDAMTKGMFLLVLCNAVN